MFGRKKKQTWSAEVYFTLGSPFSYHEQDGRFDRCSRCRAQFVVIGKGEQNNLNYCPACGAKKIKL